MAKRVCDKGFFPKLGCSLSGSCGEKSKALSLILLQHKKNPYKTHPKKSVADSIQKPQSELRNRGNSVLFISNT